MIGKKTLSVHYLYPAICFFILFLHGYSLALVGSVKINSAIAYQNSYKAFYESIKHVNYGEKILLQSDASILDAYGLVYTGGASSNRLRKAARSFFVAKHDAVQQNFRIIINKVNNLNSIGLNNN